VDRELPLLRTPSPDLIRRNIAGRDEAGAASIKRDDSGSASIRPSAAVVEAQAMARRAAPIGNVLRRDGDAAPRVDCVTELFNSAELNVVQTCEMPVGEHAPPSRGRLAADFRAAGGADRSAG
jgi:hypothetical protein